MIVGGIPMLFTALTAVPVDISLTDNAVITTDLTTYTFSAKALGVAESTRRIAVGITSNTGTTLRTISSVTIGGISASEVVFARSDDGPASTLAAIWMAAVPTGTTGDVVVTFSAGMGRCSLDIYRLLNASATAYHTATDITQTSNALSANLNLNENGAAVGVFVNSGAAVRTTTWTNITEQTDRGVELNLSASTAANTTATTQTLTITATASGTIDRYALALASFQPV